jgi:hypothetical protein
MQIIEDKTTKINYSLLVIKSNIPILHITKGISAGKEVDCGIYRDRNFDSDWDAIHSINLELTPPTRILITPALRQQLLEDLAFTYGKDTNRFSDKLKEFGFVTTQ